MWVAFPLWHIYGTLVEWIRRHPFTVEAWVRFPYVSPKRSVSSSERWFCVLPPSCFRSFLFLCSVLVVHFLFNPFPPEGRLKSALALRFICNTDVMAAYQPSKLIVRVQIPCVAPSLFSRELGMSGISRLMWAIGCPHKEWQACWKLLFSMGACALYGVTI